MERINNFLSKYPEEEQKYIKLSVFVLALSLMITVAGMIFLPEMIFVQLLSESNAPETGKWFFLLAMLFVSALSAAMCIFTDKRKKWFALQSVLAVAETVLVVYNFIAV